ncbi:MAG: hypothetical protein P8Z76_13245 [Alphaproteobacteria bacterium]
MFFRRGLAAISLLFAGLSPAIAETPPSDGAEPGEVVKSIPLPRCQGAPQCLPSFIARLKNAPFPLEANDDGEGRRFFHETDQATGLRVRLNRHGDRYPEGDHYADPSVLFHVPPGFDRTKPFRLVVFFHGHQSTLERDVVGRIGLIRQIDASGANVILIAPQLAKDAIDSHPGKLIRPGALEIMLAEAEGVLARALGPEMAPRLARAPVVLVAYSGGYRALAAGLTERQGAGTDFVGRIEGVLVFDAVFGELRRIDAWLKARAGQVFFVGLFGKLSTPWSLDLIYRWEARGLLYGQLLPAKIERGTVALIQVGTEHADIVTEGPPRQPIAEILRRLPLPR